jgi:hypothetical protein
MLGGTSVANHYFMEIQVKIFFSVSFILFLTVAIFAQNRNIAILPIQIIGTDENWGCAIETVFADKLLTKGFSIINIRDLENILSIRELTLSGVINNDIDRLELGKTLSVNLVLGVTVIWNEEYYVFDVRLTDVNIGNVVFQRIYISYSDKISILERGINTIVMNINGEEVRSAIWDRNEEYVRSVDAQNIIALSREYRRSRIILSYAGISGIQYENRKNRFDEDFNIWFDNIERKTMELFEELYNTGEYVIICPLGKISVSDYGNGSISYNEDQLDISYKSLGNLLKNQDTLVFFFGSVQEISIIMQNVNKENKRYLCWIKM